LARSQNAINQLDQVLKEIASKRANLNPVSLREFSNKFQSSKKVKLFFSSQSLMLKAVRNAHYQEALKTLPQSLYLKKLTNPQEHLKPTDLSLKLLLRNQKQNDYTSHKILKEDLKLHVGKDLYGKELSSELFQDNTNLVFSFGSALKNGGFGQYVSSKITRNSPKVSIYSKEEKFFTLCLVDLDHPDSEIGYEHEFIHWLVTDIKVNGLLEVNPTKSKFLGDKSDFNAGTVIFPYLPPHPALSNPRKAHRYVLTLLEQPSKLSLTPKQFEQEYLKNVSKKSPFFQLARDQLRNESSEGNQIKEALNAQIRNDSKQITIRKLFNNLSIENTFGMKPKGLGFFTQTYTEETSQVFKDLGIHEKVFGTVRNHDEFVRIVERGVERRKEGLEGKWF
jgi:phosphatidylethanolamine-binding protein (PEBP) family uncharacterized protein